MSTADYSVKSQRMPKVLRVYLELSQYPILSRKIRERMRQEVFARGIISPEQFEQEVREKAILSQRREGLVKPWAEEPAGVWEERLSIIRDNLTDFYFAYNLPHTLLEEIVRAAIGQNEEQEEMPLLSVHPELAPWSVLFATAEAYEKYPADKRALVQHHLEEIVVVLIKSMISDQLNFVGVAKKFFTIEDLRAIRSRRIGRGKIGGKAAGMMLAWKILQQEDPADQFPLREHLDIPESYFIGADVFYDFLTINGLLDTVNQKYKSREVVEEEYPQIQERFLQGKFPDGVVDRLLDLLEKIGDQPLIVRSSSLLEDSLGTVFAGKYDSYFCPNQGNLEENLHALLQAIALVYAGVMGPNAIFYRRHMGLIDYDERMAILLQKVEGERYRHFFFPALAGVAFSHNPFRWTPKIDPAAGLLRVVSGIGTRAVERVANDYPRMVALSHATLRPERTASDIRRYAQHFMDVIDLERNEFRTVSVAKVLRPDYPGLRYVASVDEGDYIQPLYAVGGTFSPEQIVLTFDNLLRDTDFPRLMRAMLDKLKRHFGYDVDTEFAVDIILSRPKPAFRLHLLQCRPLVSSEAQGEIRVAEGISKAQQLFSAHKLVPNAIVTDIEYIVYVDPLRYQEAPYPVKAQLARAVGRLNKQLEGKNFILMGPGRWGSSNIDLGVKVTYADIFNTKMLIEIARKSAQGTPEVSYGTHFFQDLVEARIVPLSLYPDEEGNVFNEAFLLSTDNQLATVSPRDADLAYYLKVIHVPSATGGKMVQVIMDGKHEEALAYFSRRKKLDGKPNGNATIQSEC